MKFRLAVLAAIVLAGNLACAWGEEEYLAVFMGGKKIGYAMRSRVENSGKVSTTESMNMTISRVNVPVTLSMSETCIETPAGEPVGFESTQIMSGMAVKITGQVDKGGAVKISTKTAGSEQKSEMAWPAGAVMSEGLRLLTEKKGLKEGTTFKVKVFSPSNCQAFDANISIGKKQNVDLLGRVLPLTEVKTILALGEAGQFMTTSYVSDKLVAMKDSLSIMGLDIELISCEKEFALSPNETFEIVAKLAVASPRALTAEELAGTITYRLSATTKTAKLLLPSSDNQTAKSDSNTVCVHPARTTAKASLPYKGSDPQIIESAKPSPFVQSDDVLIRKLTAEAVGDTKDAAEAARKIEGFVAKYITNKTFSVGYASAAEVAVSRQGDCTEFAVLTAAMCRAAGIPARVVFGIAYVDEFAGMGPCFGGHAWVEAYIGDKWTGLDSAFKATGRGGYNAGHIALAYGNGQPQDFFNVVSIIGQFKITEIQTGKSK